MVLLRKLLFPFAVLYGLITQLRNFLYDKGILKSHQFDIPIIAVGNLSVGGTGKTPQIEYLVRLLSPEYRVATLSRGYKRKSSGFILADESSSAETIGDEPYQFHLKFPEIGVAVDSDRANGITELLKRNEKSEVILLDDAFQHRQVRAGFYILLTSFSELYSDDFMLPTGNLREGRSGAKRANIIVVTKCPPDMSEAAQKRITEKLNTQHQKVFFSTIAYDENVYSQKEIRSIKEIAGNPKLLMAGIANPKPFFAYLQTGGIRTMRFPDHHHFTEMDLENIAKASENKIIITTEKDYVRLKDKIENVDLYYLPIKTKFIAGGENFNNTILNYVGKSTGNR